jgi:hypothetical protein
MGLLVVGLIGGTVIVYGASLQQNRGLAWADNICSAASVLCSSPGWLALLTIALTVLFYYNRSFGT